MKGVETSHWQAIAMAVRLPQIRPHTDEDEDEVMETPDLEEPYARADKGGAVKVSQSGPLDFNLSSSGVRITGSTSSSVQLKAFIEKLNALAVLVPEVSTNDG